MLHVVDPIGNRPALGILPKIVRVDFNSFPTPAGPTILEVSDDNFESEIVNSEIPSMVDFWAEWCGPCKMQTPILEKVAATIGDKAVIAKVNVDESPELDNIQDFIGNAGLACFVSIQG